MREAKAPDDLVVETIGRYCEAWGIVDATTRDAALAQVWAADASYTDPGVHLVGRAALAAHIGNVQARFPTAHIEMLSRVDRHHGLARFLWRSVLADGTEIKRGIDFAEFDGEGKIRRIVGFFD